MVQHEADLPLARPGRRRARPQGAAAQPGDALRAWSMDPAAPPPPAVTPVMRSAEAAPAPAQARPAEDAVARGPAGPAPEAIAERVMSWLRRDARLERERGGQYWRERRA